MNLYHGVALRGAALFSDHPNPMGLSLSPGSSEFLGTSDDKSLQRYQFKP